MIRIEQRAVGRDNNFNLLRMAAATAVLVSHAWPLSLGAQAVEPLYDATGYKLGTTAVTIFFAISGFFITKSFDRRVSISDFAVARIARIYPALFVVLILSVAVLGPVFTDLKLHDYVWDRHTWTYLPKNLLLAKLQWQLPGVFTANPYPGAVNGSLWTLFKEVLCYLLVALAGVTGLSTPRAFPAILAVAVAATFLVSQSEGGDLLHAASTLTLPFAIGAGAYIYRRFVPVSAVLVLALAAVAVILRGTIFYPSAHALALSYAALWFGFGRIPFLHIYNRAGDFSYGMYIYAFPVQQILVNIDGNLSPIGLILYSFPITALLAYVSWTLVEAPSLAHRHRLAAYLRLRRTGGA
jgi:peptidoglycan/LPS O-acetylase OafA/YrhL